MSGRSRTCKILQQQHQALLLPLLKHHKSKSLPLVLQVAVGLLYSELLDRFAVAAHDLQAVQLYFTLALLGPPRGARTLHTGC